jgi:hypothetical protein
MLRILSQQIIRGEMNVPVSERPIRTLAPASIGYAVAGKQDCLVWFQLQIIH